MTITAAVCANEVTLPKADVEGSKDHPLLKRYAGSFILAYQRKGFDEFMIPLSKLEEGKGRGEGGFTPTSPRESKTVEGPYTRLVYLIPPE